VVKKRRRVPDRRQPKGTAPWSGKRGHNTHPENPAGNNEQPRKGRDACWQVCGWKGGSRPNGGREGGHSQQKEKLENEKDEKGSPARESEWRNTLGEKEPGKRPCQRMNLTRAVCFRKRTGQIVSFAYNEGEMCKPRKDRRGRTTSASKKGRGGT